MGYGMGKMEILEHTATAASFQERPFVVMVDRAYVDMGTVDKNTKLTAIRSSGSMTRAGSGLAAAGRWSRIGGEHPLRAVREDRPGRG